MTLCGLKIHSRIVVQGWTRTTRRVGLRGQEEGMQLPKLDEPPRLRASSPEITAWLEAARSGVVERMLKHDLSQVRSSTDNAGWTAAHWCASRNHEKAFEWLITAGVPVDKHSSAGYTPLIIAAHRGYATLVAMLLANGAQPLPCDKSGLTSLHHAASASSDNVVRCLLESGASLTVAQAKKNRDDSTPIGIASRIAAMASGARQAQSMAVVRLLEGELARCKRWFRAARVVNYTSLEEMIERAAIPVDIIDGQGATALVMCVRACRLDSVKMLLRHGADPAHVDTHGDSVLHHLVHVHTERHGALPVLLALLRAGARPLSTDSRGQTPLQATAADAALLRRPGAAEFITALAAADSLARRMRRWRASAMVAGKLAVWHARAAERAYAPGGLGYREAEVDFEARAPKMARTA